MVSCHTVEHLGVNKVVKDHLAPAVCVRALGLV